MRRDLGRIFLALLFLFAAELFATTYKWSAYSSKTEAYVNEAIYLKYVCEFSDRGELYTIDFDPVSKNDKYSVELFSENTSIIDGKRVNTYEYIAFVKEPMLMEFAFDVLMKKTSQDSIENTVLGRDNVEKEEFLIKALKQDALKVQIKETSSDIIGDLTLSVKRDKAEIKAYEPYHMKIIIKGSGDFQVIKPIKFQIDGVKLFDEKPVIKTKLTKDGYVGTWSQKFAFVGDKNFKIPAVKFEYFDIKSDRLNKLSIKPVDVKVVSAYKKDELLDEEDTENQIITLEFAYYILTFIAGFVAAKIRFKIKKENNKEDGFIEKIKNTKSLSELSMLLILKDSKKFNKLVLDIESKDIRSLHEAKKTAELLVK